MSLSSKPTVEEFFNADDDDRRDWFEFMVMSNFARLAGLAAVLDDDEWQTHPNYAEAVESFKWHIEQILLTRRPEVIYQTLEMIGTDQDMLTNVELVLESSMIRDLPIAPVITALVEGRIKAINDAAQATYKELYSAQQRREKEISQIAKAAIHHYTNFTDRDGKSVESWGEGSDAVRRELGLPTPDDEKK